MAKNPQPVHNAAGTHTYVKNVETGQEWECPNDYLPVALQRGFELTEPRDTSLDGLFDDASAEGSAQTGFDPAEHTVDEVNDHLAQHAASSPGEVVRVLELERAGKNRTTVIDPLAPVGDDTPGD
jgi:hypothetical protein